MQQYMTRIENQVAQVGNKIDEYSMACNRGRSIVAEGDVVAVSDYDRDLKQADNNHDINSITPTIRPRSVINPVDRVLSKSGCSYNPVGHVTPKNCAQLLSAGSNCDGVYIINVQNTRYMRVYCDMNNNEGGWTVRIA
jgi:hypothetical protein